MKKIKIEYNGKYPNRCSGHLIVWLDDEKYDFGKYCLNSGGYCNYHSGEIKNGPWTVEEWPDNFPEIYKLHVEKTINEEIPWGCCGGCI